MKNILLALCIGCTFYGVRSQDTTVNFGRYGACSSGRGICGIQIQNAQRNVGNSELVWENKQLILRIFRNQISTTQRAKLMPDYPVGARVSFAPQKAFLFDKLTADFIYNLSALNITGLELKSYPVQILANTIDIQLNPDTP